MFSRHNPSVRVRNITEGSELGLGEYNVEHQKAFPLTLTLTLTLALALMRIKQLGDRLAEAPPPP